ncbi:unnamed protein product [Bursaphelenchus okinawaensis]|uniref:HIT-type domain-containing protein n=1 Tax=Bursaphelenchus okinawaensis TaxID=465554 RepID=A0A811L175_9BILA|nr:unnamed protein product [Bursaphelenchus okinawaensis]CAG9114656.1 unnamed protein product [Bursaphelenchus okinawaensis]
MTSKPNFSTCEFCKLDFKETYKCPKCKRNYCTLRCYKSKNHAECSNAFYQDQIARFIGKELDETDSDDQSADEDEVEQKEDEEEMKEEEVVQKEEKAEVKEDELEQKAEQKEDKSNVKPEASAKNKSDKPKKALQTFAEYMAQHAPEDRQKSEAELNPQIGLKPGEELVIDEDDEPEYLQDVYDQSMKDFEKLSDSELNAKLKEIGLDPEKDDDLFSRLTPDERKNFERIAEEMFGIKQETVFKK